jgi:glycosyltransferase involved in cell wall biosynthesis
MTAMKSTLCSTPTPQSLPLSVIIITYNEASNIGDCIASVSFARQVVVLDGASTDDTVHLARALGAEVHVNTPWPGFGAQKNRALALANQPWVLSLDADERVTPELAQEIEQIVSNNQPLSVSVPRLTEFFGHRIHHCGWTPDYVTRLWPRGNGQFSDDRVHERVVTSGIPARRLTHSLLHYSYPTPAHYWHKLSSYSQAWAEQRHAKGVRTSLARAFLSGVFAFLKSYIWRLGFLDGAMGLVVCTMQAQAAYGKYLTLYCLQRQAALKRA